MIVNRPKFPLGFFGLVAVTHGKHSGAAVSPGGIALVRCQTVFHAERTLVRNVDAAFQFAVNKFESA